MQSPKTIKKNFNQKEILDGSTVTNIKKDGAI